MNTGYRDVAEKESCEKHNCMDYIESFSLLRQVQQLLLERLAEGASSHRSLRFVSFTTLLAPFLSDLG